MSWQLSIAAVLIRSANAAARLLLRSQAERKAASPRLSSDARRRRNWQRREEKLRYLSSRL